MKARPWHVYSNGEDAFVVPATFLQPSGWYARMTFGNIGRWPDWFGQPIVSAIVFRAMGVAVAGLLTMILVRNDWGHTLGILLLFLGAFVWAGAELGVPLVARYLGYAYAGKVLATDYKAAREVAMADGAA